MNPNTQHSSGGECEYQHDHDHDHDHAFSNDLGNGASLTESDDAAATGTVTGAVTGPPGDSPADSTNDRPTNLLTDLVETEPEAIIHLRAAVQAGVYWPRALLEAIGLWTAPLEIHQGRTYCYLIQGEALDWLTLAERLCLELERFAPAEELELLLFDGELPSEVTPEQFREWIGSNKHRAYLNYWYGVVVEEALQQAVEDDVRKRHRARCYPDNEDLVEEAFTHLYGESRTTLLKEFRISAKIAQRAPLSLTNYKEFTYWLSKRRFNLWDPARVASDTRKGIRKLNQLEQIPGPLRPSPATAPAPASGTETEKVLSTDIDIDLDPAPEPEPEPETEPQPA